MHRSRIAAVVLLLVPLSLSGCATSVGSCVDHVSLPTPQARFDAADAVVLATVERTDRTVESNAVYRVFRAHVVTTLKGRMRRSSFDVYNPSDQCTTSGRPAQYLERDALGSTSRAVLYLSADDRVGAFSLVVPNAVDAAPVGAPLPSLTSTPTPR